MKRKLLILLSITLIFILFSCKNNDQKVDVSYKKITMDEAKEIFEMDGDYVILDVRRPDEFAQGHIPCAINIPNETIGKEKLVELPNEEQAIYVYCRSGNRSKQAAQKLVEIGYKNVIEFGGIIDWTGEVIKLD